MPNWVPVEILGLATINHIFGFSDQDTEGVSLLLEDMKRYSVGDMLKGASKNSHMLVSGG